MASARYKLWPREGVYIEPAQQQAIAHVLDSANFFDRIPTGREVVVEVGRGRPAGLTLAEAHEAWHAQYFETIQTPQHLPRQPMDAKTPDGLVHVEVSVIEQRTPGMGSHFGYKGYYLSVLVDLEKRIIWDVRGEPAS